MAVNRHLGPFNLARSLASLDVHKLRKLLDFAWKGALCFEPGIEVLLLIVQESGCVFP